MRKKLFILLLFIGLLVLSACNTPPPVSSDFISCLDEGGVKMYGAFWCGHCAEQKKILGKEVSQIYIECDARGENEQSELCIEKGIEAYPTFELANGSFVSGVYTASELAEITGCALD